MSGAPLSRAVHYHLKLDLPILGLAKRGHSKFFKNHLKIVKPFQLKSIISIDKKCFKIFWSNAKGDHKHRKFFKNSKITSN
jgi:hypothetical protein